MTLGNPCEFVKRIHKDPFAKITDLSIKELQQLKEHLTICPECDKLVTEVLETYKDIQGDDKTNDERWN